MANWSAKRDPQPDRRDVGTYKNFIKQKYVEKKFMTKQKDSEDSSDEVKEKKKKKSKKAKVVQSSSDSEQE